MRKYVIAVLILCAFAAHAEEGQGRYYGATFPATFMLYIMSPDVIVGWNGTLRETEKKYIPEKYQKLPVVGGWYSGSTADKEVLLRSNIKKALLLRADESRDSAAEVTLREINIPSVVLKSVTMQDYINVFRSLGKELNMQERGEELAQYAENSLKTAAEMMKGYPENQRFKVYFAQGGNGLETVCSGSYREEAIALAGGSFVHKCPSGTDISTISFEQLVIYDPDVILVQNPNLMNTINKDPRWKRLRAVKAGRIFSVPYEPFAWLDRPPSFMRIVGLPWLICKIHPDRCSVNMEAETAKFIKTFFGLNMSAPQIKEMLCE
ncbi:hypothetical protein EP073_08915 [Geovibrio thiophilus]|uniref:Fe/B12 periplasmic-binding domain-containing protein n=1 Tax=Geovibrio thiophilus TaxID=139438 RepID=A0A3R5V1S9_9BACT|nr:ABC transporter substrate-binding protein [Geovibrio thiophilus]QAR33516.1 hypothetical protein EP073_08915 [Geovibrio thiophilus]